MGKPTMARVTGDAFYCLESAAEAAIKKMESAATFKDRLMLSWVALLRDPCCIAAHVFRGRHAKNPERRLAHLRAVVNAGIDLCYPVAAEEGNRMSWWGFTATRPYMRAIQALSMEHGASNRVFVRVIMASQSGGVIGCLRAAASTWDGRTRGEDYGPGSHD